MKQGSPFEFRFVFVSGYVYANGIAVYGNFIVLMDGSSSFDGQDSLLLFCLFYKFCNS